MTFKFKPYAHKVTEKSRSFSKGKSSANYLFLVASVAKLLSKKISVTRRPARFKIKF